jgi:hypothetical protein
LFSHQLLLQLLSGETFVSGDVIMVTLILLVAVVVALDFAISIENRSHRFDP